MIYTFANLIDYGDVTEVSYSSMKKFESPPSECNSK